MCVWFVNKFEFLDQCRQMESHCFKTFSNPTEKPWGTMFYNPNLPERHDANHAEVNDPVYNPFTIIKEISEFYSQRNLSARVNFYDPDKNHPFKKKLEEENFKCLDNDSTTTFMILHKKIKLEDILNDKDNLRVSFTPALPPDSIIGNDIAKVLHSDWWYQNIVTHNDYYYFILYDGDEAVSVLSFFLYENFKLARLDDVVTRPEKRNRGYNSFLLKFASNWVQNNDYTPYLFVNNEVAENVYTKVGFEEVFSCQKVYWIKEINN